MTKRFERLLTAALPAVLLLALPVAARAECNIFQADYDKNGSKDMNIFGSNVTNEHITVNVSPTNTVVTGCGAHTYTDNFGTYFFKPNGGTDTVTFNVVGTWVGMHKVVNVQAGIGVTKITIGGAGSMTAGSSLIVEVNGMQGTDTLAVVPPAMDGSALDVRTMLAPGKDAVILKLDNPITGGSVFNFNADLGGDNNVFKFTQSATGFIDATVNISILSGSGADSGTFILGGPVGPNGRLYYRQDLGAGADLFDGQVSLPFFNIAAGGEVHVDVFGNAGNDVLRLSRNGSAGGPTTVNAGLMEVTLNGGSEADVIQVDLAGGGFLLDGTLRIREDGGSGNDNLSASVDVQAGSTTPNLDVVLFGGPGSDQMATTINNNGPNGAGSYGPAGTALLDGGLDPGDHCTTGGNGVVHKRNCES